MVAADFNGDGKPDLALSTGGSIAILLNAGDGTFGSAAFYSTGVVANYVTAGDINHDGITDLAVVGSNGFAVLRGTGAGAFTAPLILPQGFGQFWVGIADFNGDGNPDLVGDGSPGQFYAGNGDCTFATPVARATLPYGIVVGDFNADGKPDLAYLITTFNQERVAGQQISVLIGNGAGQFLDALNIFFTGPGSGQIAAGDFNGDGRTDLAIWLTSSARLFLLPGVNSVLTAAPVDLSSVASTATLPAADIDGNRSRDLLLLDSTMVASDTPVPVSASLAGGRKPHL